MPVQITIDIGALRDLIAERDQLRDRICELELTPLEFSLEKLANDTANHIGGGYTSDQLRKIRAVIKNGGWPQMDTEAPPC